MKYIWKLDYMGEAYYTTREALLIDNEESLPPEMPGRYTLDRHDWTSPWQKTFTVNLEDVTVRIERHPVYSTPQVRDMNAEEINQNKKKCSDCNIAKPRSDFYDSSKYKDGLSTYCKECSIKRASSSRRNN